MEERKNEPVNSILAILGGSGAAFVAGFLLYPLEMLVFDRFFELDFGGSPKGFTSADFILNGSLVLWFSMAAWCGGWVCSMIAKNREHKHTLVLFGLSLIFFIVIYADARRIDDFILVTVMIIAVFLSFLLGSKMGVRLKKNKLR